MKLNDIIVESLALGIETLKADVCNKSTKINKLNDIVFALESEVKSRGKGSIDFIYTQQANKRTIKNLSTYVEDLKIEVNDLTLENNKLNNDILELQTSLDSVDEPPVVVKPTPERTPPKVILEVQSDASEDIEVNCTVYDALEDTEIERAERVMDSLGAQPEMKSEVVTDAEGNETFICICGDKTSNVIFPHLFKKYVEQNHCECKKENVDENTN